MSNNRTSEVTGPTVIAIAQEENSLRAVCLRKQGGVLQVLWTRSSEAGQTDLGTFAAECGLSAGRTGQIEPGGGTMAVVGFNSAGVTFYRILVPAVKEEEIAQMVKLQIEARLPLPAEQIELAWRAGPVRSGSPSRTGSASAQTSNGAGRVQDGRVAVTIAAARREQISKFVEDVRVFEPAKILLDCEGIVEAWREFFAGDEGSRRDGIVVSIGSRNTQVCLVEFGRLSNAVVIDTGMEDFSAGQWLGSQTETAERFAQDMRSVLELFGYAEPGELPVFVLSDGGSVIEGIASCLESAGLNVRVVVPVPPLYAGVREKTELSADDIYEYRVPIGLGLMALEAGAEELNIFERLYNPAGEKEKKHRLYSPKVAGAIAAVMLVAVVIVSYAVDVASPNAIEKRFRAAASDADMNLLMERQKLIKTIAPRRPDLLQLLNEINVTDAAGIMLDSLDFKKGRPISMSGQAPNAEQLYKFQRALLAKKGITEVKIQNTASVKAGASPSPRGQGGPGGGRIKFTITFHYKNFTR